MEPVSEQWKNCKHVPLKYTESLQKCKNCGAVRRYIEPDPEQPGFQPAQWTPWYLP